MSARIRAVDYFTTTLHGAPEEAYRLLESLAAGGVNLLAFNAIPVGLEATQLVVFPEDSVLLTTVCSDRRVELSGPECALLIQGEDQLGAFARIHEQLAEVKVHPYASAGVTDGRGGFGYIVYVRRQDLAAATQALGL